jgi:hypothetical protein
MSTPTEILLTGLIDDAAVFPPGNTPLPQALEAHRRHCSAWYAPFIGPLLVPAGATAELTRLVAEGAEPGTDSDSGSHSGGAEPLRVGLVARPGEDPAFLTAAAAGLRETPSIEVALIEAGWQPGWRGWLREETRIALEIPRGEDRRRGLDDIANASSECVDAIAKYRTGATPTWAWPDEEDLAEIIDLVVGLDLTVKLTGGLHHVVRAEHGPGGDDPQHGLLNIFCAIDASMRGAGAEDVAEQLRRRDADSLADDIDGWAESRARAVRATLISYGCCDVTDPIGEFVDLDLLEEH